MKKSKSVVNTLRAYYRLTKPGIIRGNLITVTAGYLLASRHSFDIWGLVAVLIGSALCIASGCVFNNYLDRGIDSKMERTKNRALVTGEISGRAALAYASVLGIAGLLVLREWTNPLTVKIGALGIIAYVLVYGFAKRKSIIGTIVGSISGAIPPLAGYTAAAGEIDLGAMLIFLVLVLWQMPHFYAISIYRGKEYTAAGIPVMGAVKSMKRTKLTILAYIIAFTITASMLTAVGYTSFALYAVVVCLGAYWFWHGAAYFDEPDHPAWARKMFGVSLMVITFFSAAIYLDSIASLLMV